MTSLSATRGRDIHEQHRAASPLELLFDLTSVVAVALAAAQLHHAERTGGVVGALPGYLLAFFAIWWAWMNFTWFSSAYDDDDATYRLLTLLQMVGALVFAAGVPALFVGHTHLAVAGYVAMRLPLCVQWWRAARGDPERRRTCLRYAGGVAGVQALWLAQSLTASSGVLPPSLVWSSVVALVLLELGVPLWAESCGPPTPWHAHHIAERYSGFLIIILGESILSTANAIAGLIEANGLTAETALVGLGCTLLTFCLWWMYFLLPSGEALHAHRARSFGWGYGHFATFAALAAVGSGLGLVADVSKQATRSPARALVAVAIPLAIFVASIWVIHRYVTRVAVAPAWLWTLVLACIALGPWLVAAGLPLRVGLLLLSLGPIVAILHFERERRCRRDASQEP